MWRALGSVVAVWGVLQAVFGPAVRVPYTGEPEAPWPQGENAA